MKIANSHFTRCAAAILVLCMVIAPAVALTAQVNQPILPKGLPLSISGQTDFPGVAVWIIGKNHYERRTFTTKDDAFTEELFTAETTRDLASGQYFLIIEDTGPNAKFALDIAEDGEQTIVCYQGMPLFALDDPETVYSDTAMALSEALNRPEIDDASMKLVFLVEEPWIRIDQSPTGHPGDLLRFSGSTNLPPGHEISYLIYPASANPCEGDEVAESGTIEVVKGGSHNYWFVDIDTGELDSEEYVLNLDSGPTAATTTFVLCDNRFTVPPTPAITVETLQEGPEEVSCQPTEPEPISAETTGYETIPTTDELIYTTDEAVIWCSAIDGEYITWAERTEDEKTNIYLYDIPAGTTRTIVEGATYLSSTMDISGDHIAWEILSVDPNLKDGIGLYSISTDTIEVIPFQGYHISQIAMDGDLIAFSGVDLSAVDHETNQRDMMLYSISTNTTQVLCNASGHQIEPAIGEGYVVWLNSKGEFGEPIPITIHSLADQSQTTLSPPEGALYGTPFVGGGMVVAPLHYYDDKTYGPYKTEIVAITLPEIKTMTIPLPETPRRYNPHSNGELIVWEERIERSSSRIFAYDITTGTVLEPSSDSTSLFNPNIDDNHLFYIDSDESRGVRELWLATFTGERQPGEATGEGTGAGALPDASTVGFGVMAAGIAAVVVLWKRGSR